ncbi:MAG: hypothetical protein HYT97_06535 [Elusimicrobia bacterium]|nr:hypothetical protein [Elusimicrobiota bacterium]
MGKQNVTTKSVSRTRNPKQEIVESYGDLLKQVQEQKTEDPRKIKKAEEEQAIVQKTAALSGESLPESRHPSNS